MGDAIHNNPHLRPSTGGYHARHPHATFAGKRRGGDGKPGRGREEVGAAKSFDFAEAQRVAFAELGQTQEEFWSTSIAEHNLALQGIFLREERHMELNAHWVALLLTGQTGEKITADMLLLGVEEAQAIEEEAAEAKADALIKRTRNAHG